MVLILAFSFINIINIEAASTHLLVINSKLIGWDIMLIISLLGNTWWQQAKKYTNSTRKI